MPASGHNTFFFVLAYLSFWVQFNIVTHLFFQGTGTTSIQPPLSSQREKEANRARSMTPSLLVGTGPLLDAGHHVDTKPMAMATIDHVPPNSKDAINPAKDHNGGYNVHDKNQGRAYPPHTDGDTSFPEGGFGWLVVFAAFMANFMTLGVNQTFGVYQNHYLSIHAFENATETSISWVGSIAAGVLLLPGPFTLPMIRLFTLRVIVFVGIVLASSGYLLASCATQLWHLYLTQGLLFGWGGGMVFFATISLPSQYFEKKRGLATGLAVSGAGIGGLVWAPVTNWLIRMVGIRWCQRVVGLVILMTLLSILPFIRPWVPVSSGLETTGGRGWKRVFEWKLFKIRGFLWLVMAALILPFGKNTHVLLKFQRVKKKGAGRWRVSLNTLTNPLLFFSS